MLTTIREVWLLFRYYPLRWTLSVIGLIVGMATLTALTTIENNINLHAQELMAEQGGSRLGITIVKSGIYPLDFKQWKSHFSGNYYAIPYYSVPLKVQFNDESSGAEVIATVPALFKKTAWHLQKGRALHTLDKQSKVIVVGSEFAKHIEQKSQQSALGVSISLNGEYFTVIGILEELSFDPILNFDPNHSIFFHLGFSEYFIKNVVLENFVFFLNNISLTNAETNIKNIVHKLHPQSTLFIKNPIVLQKMLFKQIDLTTKILRIVSIIALFLGFISMLNQFILQLEERKSELGVRLAFGATLNILVLQFFKETLLLSTLSGIVGMIIGSLGAGLVLHQLALTFHWGLTSFITACSMVLLIGGLVSVVPAILLLRKLPANLV